jgi:hypothetical protein
LPLADASFQSVDVHTSAVAHDGTGVRLALDGDSNKVITMGGSVVASLQ